MSNDGGFLRSRQLDPRPEGAYVSIETAPGTGTPYDRTLFSVERVNGNGTTDRLVLTSAEAREVFERLATGLVALSRDAAG